MLASFHWLFILLLAVFVGSNVSVSAAVTNWANDYGTGTPDEGAGFEIQCGAVDPTTGDNYGAGYFDGEVWGETFRCIALFSPNPTHIRYPLLLCLSIQEPR